MSKNQQQGLVMMLVLLVWATFNVFAHHGAIMLGASAIGISLISVAAAAVLMLSWGWGHLRTFNQALKHPLTWLYALCRVGTVICMTLAFTSLTPGTAMFLSVVDILFTLPLVWWVLARRPNVTDSLLCVVLLIGLMGMTQHLENTWLNFGLWMMLAEGVLNAVMVVVMEKHPAWPSSQQWRARAAFTGVILLATSVALYLLCLLVAGLFAAGVEVHLGLAWLNPEIVWQALTQPTTWMAGIALGLLFRAPMMLMSFVALKGLKSELYTAAWAIFPLLTWGAEWCLYYLGWMVNPPMVGEGLAWGLLMVAALATMAGLKVRLLVAEKK